MTDISEPIGTASASITLESIPLDDLTLIALKLDLPSLGRLAALAALLLWPPCFQDLYYALVGRTFRTREAVSKSILVTFVTREGGSRGGLS